MCDAHDNALDRKGTRAVPLKDAVGTVLAHDITEIRPGEFKGRAFRKGHIISEEDICRLQRLGKDRLYVLSISDDEMHEDDAAYAFAEALISQGACIKGEPREGKIDIIAECDGLLKIDREALKEFNMLGEVMCATMHDNTLVKKGQTVGGTRAIPLVIKKKVVREAVEALRYRSVIRVLELKKPKAGVVITGNEIYYGRIQDAFGPVISQKIHEYGGQIQGLYYAPDDELFIEARLRELIDAGCDLLITTGGMSVDPDDVTRFAIRRLAADDVTYGSAVLPGAMFLVAYIENVQSSGTGAQRRELSDNNSNVEQRTSNIKPIPVLGIPACGMYAKTTVFDLVLPRILAGEKIGRRELAELGHGGLCLRCEQCRYPVCPFGKV